LIARLGQVLCLHARRQLRRARALHAAGIALVFAAGCTHKEIAPPAAARVQPAACPATAPVLAYHRVSPKITNQMTVTPALFREHMRYLARHGFSTISIDQWCNAVERGAPLPARPVIITFDDGWKDQIVYAAPILREFGFLATFYIYPTVIGSPLQLSWDDVRALAAQGHAIGSHSLSHTERLNRPYAFEDQARYERRLMREVYDSKREIEANISRPVVHFCYPYGYYNTAVMESLERAGYRTAVTVNPQVNSSATPLMTLGRRIVGPAMRDAELAEYLERLPLPVATAVPGDGMICTDRAGRVRVSLSPQGAHLVDARLKLSFRWVDSTWDPRGRTISYALPQPLEPGAYTAELHAWDARSNHYVYAWLFQQDAAARGASVAASSSRRPQ